jgi:hydroxymethylpyrimidine/phosphomethylpyrimidine kinase
MPNPPPIVLCFSGHDPTGGAGLQADIETLSALGCRPCTVVTALTAQDTSNVVTILPQNKFDFLQQSRLLIADLPVSVVKIGLLGSSEIAMAVVELLKAELTGIPVVLDPVLAAGGGTPLAKEDLLDIIRHQLLPLTFVSTPNIPEARQLSVMESPDECATVLMGFGCQQVFITGTHSSSAEVVNRLYGPQGMKSWQWPRLPHEYHGSGCTLASALAAGLANGLAMELACLQAQQFTWDSLATGFPLGKGQWLPNRTGLHCD